MLLELGFELIYNFPQPTPVILAVELHPSRSADVIAHRQLRTNPPTSIMGYRDGFGNHIHRLIAPAGRVSITNGALIQDAGLADPFHPLAWQHTVESLPDDTLVFLLGSRYCETDVLTQAAWDLFGNVPPGWQRVQAVCDYVHNHIQFNYKLARPTRTAAEAFSERTGVCRDYAHLAISFCRALNIPARYCTGYLGDVGLEPPYDPGDFAAWMEVYLAGQWHTFDPRNNTPRQSRVLMARGRDAADVAIATTFGPNCLESFRVWADEVDPRAANIHEAHAA